MFAVATTKAEAVLPTGLPSSKTLAVLGLAVALDASAPESPARGHLVEEVVYLAVP